MYVFKNRLVEFGEMEAMGDRGRRGNYGRDVIYERIY